MKRNRTSITCVACIGLGCMVWLLPIKRTSAQTTNLSSKSHSWNQPPTQRQQRDTPGLRHRSIESRLMKTTVGYNVVLPPDYESPKQRRYPVVYWLHGGGGNENSDIWTSSVWRQAIQNAAIDGVILVYPNGGRSSYWDHFDGKTMMESFIIQELIPDVDAQYRTVANRTGRAIHGFSMGSSGALKFAIKYPELFCSVVAYGGGAIDLESTQMPFVTKILKRNLNGDPALIRANNTYRLLQQNHETIRQLKIPFLLITGSDDTWKSSAVDFHNVLRRHNISSQLVLVPQCGHDIGRLIKAEGKRAAEFQDRLFKSFTTNPTP